jgi:hypothetical protein
LLKPVVDFPLENLILTESTQFRSSQLTRSGGTLVANFQSALKMKIELKFDVDIYNKQMDLLFDLAWKRKTEYYRNSHYLGFILLLIAIFLFVERPSFFAFAILIFSLGILIPYFYYYFKIKSLYKKLETEKAMEIEALKKQNLVFCEFTETCLIMESEGQQRKWNWEDFVAQLVKEDNLFMFTKENEPIILGELEVGKDNFKMIVDFVDAKICH